MNVFYLDVFKLNEFLPKPAVFVQQSLHSHSARGHYAIVAVMYGTTLSNLSWALPSL